LGGDEIMNLSLYLGKRVKIHLIVSNYYYIGKVVSVESDSLDLIDFKGKPVSLRKEDISRIQEVGK